ncbi:MAG TPA: S8 family serine peptidase [Steroidobacteraceae bacterium]|nr:S8 family serine peptidase [Steroidobacteraceae bacterium]
MALCLGVLGTAKAQLGLPSLHLPSSLPTTLLPGGLQQSQPGLANDLDTSRPQDARRRIIRDLLHRYPRLLERDPHGEPIVRGELLVLSPSDAALAAAKAAGFSVLREEVLRGLGGRVLVLSVPAGMRTERALAKLRAVDPAAVYDFNHIYVASGAADASSLGDSPAVESSSPGPSLARRVRIGLIDDGVDVRHPVFANALVHTHGCAGKQVPGTHGTAVASLMVGQAARFRGAAPGAELYAADVYCGLPTGGAVDAIAVAFDWLVQQRVPVINVSLVGPANGMLESVVRSLVAQGYLIVAAVGNDGPSAPPLYPAAYPGVVGVTAVDGRRRVLIEAERGPQVKFAAPGADMAAADPPRSYALVRGTSFAAPIVAGLLAERLGTPDKVLADSAVMDLAREAVDLGARGIDPVYGYGFVGAEIRPAPALASTRAQ